MKKFFLLILVVLCPNLVNAQTDSLTTAYQRIENLENNVRALNNRIVQLSNDLEKVISQNLALKKNLKLQPTVATDNVENVEYKILSVEGDTCTNIVTVTILAENLGTETKWLWNNNQTIIDENGNTYRNKYDQSTSQLILSGSGEDITINSAQFIAGVPTKMILTIKTLNPEVQYIKYLGLTSGLGYYPDFRNLPIRWN